jgi:hypothetical protein
MLPARGRHPSALLDFPIHTRAGPRSDRCARLPRGPCGRGAGRRPGRMRCSAPQRWGFPADVRDDGRAARRVSTTGVGRRGSAWHGEAWHCTAWIGSAGATGPAADAFGRGVIGAGARGICRPAGTRASTPLAQGPHSGPPRGPRTVAVTGLGGARGPRRWRGRVPAALRPRRCRRAGAAAGRRRPGAGRTDSPAPCCSRPPRASGAARRSPRLLRPARGPGPPPG